MNDPDAPSDQASHGLPGQTEGDMRGDTSGDMRGDLRGEIPNASPAPSSSPHASFPNEGARCESCGYPLTGLPLTAVCPECGRAVMESHPNRRTAPAWRYRQRPGSWLRTALSITLRPSHTYARLDLTGSNAAPRCFLAIVALLCFVITATLLLREPRLSPVFAWGMAMLATKVVILMTYIEALGATFFSRRHGWPLGLHRAERVVCYASVGWIPAMAIMSAAAGWLLYGSVPLACRLGLGLSGHEPAMRWASGLSVFCLSVLGFETLVWTGIRRIRFGNTPDAS